MDGVGPETGSGVLVLAATNRPWTLDRAILRRFEKKIFIPLPEEDARLAVLDIHLSKIPNDISVDERREIACDTDGWSGSELRALVKEAGFLGLRALNGATHFRKVGAGEKFTVSPCADSHVDAEAMSLIDVESKGWMDRLELPPLTAADLRAAMSTAKGGSALSAGEEEQLLTFTTLCGSVG
jgi:vacuolar protein-sorting-associated protein 4